MSLSEPEESLNFEMLLRLRGADNRVVPATKVGCSGGRKW